MELLVDFGMVERLVRTGNAASRMKALLILSNLLDLNLISGKTIDWLPVLVGEVPANWTLNDISVALPMLKRAGYPVGELTCDVFSKVAPHERQSVAEWIVRNADSLGVQTHVRISPALSRPT